MNGSETTTPAPTIFDTKDEILHGIERTLTGEPHELEAKVCLTFFKVDRLQGRAEVLAGHEQHTPVESVDFFEARRLESEQDERHFMVEINRYVIMHKMEEATSAFELPEEDPTRKDKLNEILTRINNTQQTLLPIVISMESRAPEAVLQRASDHKTPFARMMIDMQEQ